MSTSVDSKIIELQKRLSDNLAFRKSINDIFDSVEMSPENKIIFDFENVRTMSRSFAHQYLLRKKLSKKSISNINISEHVKKMFEVVERNKTDNDSFDPKKIICLTI